MALLGYRPIRPKPAPLRLFLPQCPSSFRTSLPCYCCWKPTRKPRLLKRVLGLIVVALSRTQGRPIAPGTTPCDPIRARCRSGRVHHRVAGGIGRLVPVRGPFPHISMHIKKAPRVGVVIAHITSLAQSTTRVISPGCINVISPRIHCVRTRTAGIFPLRLGG